MAEAVQVVAFQEGDLDALARRLAWYSRAPYSWDQALWALYAREGSFLTPTPAGTVAKVVNGNSLRVGIIFSPVSGQSIWLTTLPNAVGQQGFLISGSVPRQEFYADQHANAPAADWYASTTGPAVTVTYMEILKFSR